MKAIIAYLSYSGNTEEVAELIEKKLVEKGYEIEMHRIGIDAPINPDSADYVFVGTFTWENGSVPEEMVYFVEEVGYKPDNIAVFGTGDTQFGGDRWFCKAVDTIAEHYNSRWESLKIEQSPRGKQEEQVLLWTERVLEDVRIKN